MSAAHPDIGTLMVTLSHHGDGVSIGPDIEVRFAKIIDNNKSVRLAIMAPKSVEISRFRRVVVPAGKLDKPVDELEETLRMVRATAH